MTDSEKALVTFQTRLRDFIQQFQNMKKENEELYALVEETDRKVGELKARIEQQERDYQSLKMARMMEITDLDLEKARERVAKQIRTINKCIALLSDEK